MVSCLFKIQQAKASTLEVREEDEEETTMDYRLKLNGIDLIARALTIENFSFHAALKGMPYEKMKVFHEKAESLKDGIRVVEMLAPMIPEMAAAEEWPVAHPCR